jgi:hypothetical protein
MSFDVAAEAYDGYMGAWSRQLSPQLVAFAGVRPSLRAIGRILLTAHAWAARAVVWRSGQAGEASVACFWSALIIARAWSRSLAFGSLWSAMIPQYTSWMARLIVSSSATARPPS